MRAINLGAAFRRPVDRSTFWSFSALKTLGPAIAGLGMLVAAIFLWGPPLHRAEWTAGAIAVLLVAGTGAFLFGITARVGHRQRSLIAANAALEIELSDAATRARTLETSKMEAEATLSLVPFRLMLLDRDMRLKAVYSNALEALFQRERRGPATFLDILRGTVSEEVLEAAREHFTAMFDAREDEAWLANHSPLRAVEIAAPQPDGSLLVRFVALTIRRIYVGADISSLLVAVEDVTDSVEADRRLRESETLALKNFDTLLSILHLEPRVIDEFLMAALNELSAVDRAMRAAEVTARGSGDAGPLRQRLAGVSERVSTVKEAAALLKLTHVERQTQAYLDKLDLLQSKAQLSGEDFMALMLEQANLRAELGEMQNLRVRLSSLQRARQLQGDATDDMLTALAAAAREMAGQLGKSVAFDTEGFDSRGLEPERRLLVKEILSELVRNAVVHGIETPEGREAAGKPRVGTIEIKPMRDAQAGAFAFTVRDDGCGLDPMRIRNRAVQLGLIERDHAFEMSDSEAAGYIFVPGFTGIEEVLGERSRGVGLNTVKTRVVDETGGAISIDSEAGVFCEFSFALPPKRVALASRAS